MSDKPKMPQVECPYCRGSGRLSRLINPAPLDALVSDQMWEKIKCWNCNGTGKVDEEAPKEEVRNE